MTNGWRNYIQREISGLHQAAYLLAFFAVMSQLLGLVRDRLLAGAFGAGGTLDMYYAAFRIPDFIFISVGSMVSVAVIIPFMIEKMKGGDREGKKFLDNVFSFFFLTIVVVCAAAFLLAPKLSAYIFPGFTGDELSHVVLLTRVLLLSPILLGLSNLLGAITQMYQRFFLYSLSPMIYNVGIIAGVLVLYPAFGIVGLAAGVVAGALFHLAIQIPFIAARGMLPRFSIPFDFAEIGRVFKVSLPRTFALGSESISVMFLLSIASLLPLGSIAVFSFSFNLQSVPLTIVGVSYSLAAFPILTQLYSKGEKDKFLEQMVVSARHIIFWTLPISALFVVLRAQIVRTVLGSGQFNWDDTRLTSAALALFAVSLVFQCMTLLFVRAYYASGNTRTPFVAKALNAASTIALGFVFLALFEGSPGFRDFLESALRVKGVFGTAVLALPLGWSVGELLNTLALWAVFEKDFKGFSRSIGRTLLDAFLASAAVGVVAYRMLDVFDGIFNLDTLPGIFFQGLFSGLFGIAAGILVLVLLKNREAADVWRTLHRKIWKAKTVVPDTKMTA